MIKTCEKKYSSSWLTVIQKTFQNNKFDLNPKGLCEQKAGHFKQGAQVGGKEKFTGSDTWCKNPCVAQYLIGKKGFYGVGEGQGLLIDILRVR